MTQKNTSTRAGGEPTRGPVERLQGGDKGPRGGAQGPAWPTFLVSTGSSLSSKMSPRESSTAVGLQDAEKPHHAQHTQRSAERKEGEREGAPSSPLAQSGPHMPLSLPLPLPPRSSGSVCLCGRPGAALHEPPRGSSWCHVDQDPQASHVLMTVKLSPPWMGRPGDKCSPLTPWQ